MAVLLGMVTADPAVMAGAVDLEADVSLCSERNAEAEDVVDDERGCTVEDEREDALTDELDGKREENPADEPEEEPELEGFEVEPLVVAD